MTARADVIVEHAKRASDHRDERRKRGSARRRAAKRVERRKTPLRHLIEDNGLSIAAFGLFILSFIGQIVAGFHTENEDLRNHGSAELSLGEYLTTGAFWEATSENWESEFLQLGIFVLLTAFLHQRGSSESKKIEEPEGVDEDPNEARFENDAPRPVKRGGWALLVYRHSLSIALLFLFAVSFVTHAVSGNANQNAARLFHGQPPLTVWQYLGTSQFWFESFQNWQSEFLAVGVLVLLTIWLRQERSPQSKPVAAANKETGV